MTQKTEIVFEVEETFVLKQGGKIVAGHCPRCHEDLDFVSPDILALATGTGEREIFRLVEKGMIHFDETDRLVVCPNCYKNSVTQRDS